MIDPDGMEAQDIWGRDRYNEMGMYIPPHERGSKEGNDDNGYERDKNGGYKQISTEGGDTTDYLYENGVKIGSKKVLIIEGQKDDYQGEYSTYGLRMTTEGSGVDISVADVIGALIGNSVVKKISGFFSSSKIAVNTAKGWKVGQPITNLTSKGNVPVWSTVRQRFWKNEAYYNFNNYSDANLLRMKRGLAPQRVNPYTGVMESMELHHHLVPQRNGGLFDFIKVWPDEHRALDPFRK